jgi:hypothetical protein
VATASNLKRQQHQEAFPAPPEAPLPTSSHNDFLYPALSCARPTIASGFAADPDLHLGVRLNADSFLSKFLKPLKGNSPAILLEKAQHWISALESPEQHFPNANEFELRIRRRNALQALRRLLLKHPELIAALRGQQ